MLSSYLRMSWRGDAPGNRREYAYALWNQGVPDLQNQLSIFFGKLVWDLLGPLCTMGYFIRKGVLIGHAGRIWVGLDNPRWMRIRLHFPFLRKVFPIYATEQSGTYFHAAHAEYPRRLWGYRLDLYLLWIIGNSNSNEGTAWSPGIWTEMMMELVFIILSGTITAQESFDKTRPTNSALQWNCEWTGAIYPDPRIWRK